MDDPISATDSRTVSLRELPGMVANRETLDLLESRFLWYTL